ACRTFGECGRPVEHEVITDHGAGRERIVEHARDARATADFDRVDHLAPLVAASHHENRVHGATAEPVAGPSNGGIVTWSALETPRPLSTSRAVRARISRSRRNDR